MTLATVPEATTVLRIVKDGPARALETPVWIDVARADAIYADFADVVVEQGPKVWRFTTPSAETAQTRAREFSVMHNARSRR